MNASNPQSAAFCGDDPPFVELFDLELTYQVQTYILPAIRASMGSKPKPCTFASVSIPANNHAQGGESKQPETGSKRKRSCRKRFRKSKPGLVRDLAARLARCWKAPLCIDRRLNPAV